MKIADFDHVVFDFNGTILDDVDLGISCINKLLSRRNLPLITSREQYLSVFGFPIIDYYARVGLDINDYDALAHEWVAEYRAGENTAPLRDGVLELIKGLYDAKIPLTVLSATESRMLWEQMKNLGIDRYFSDICGNDNIYAASKETAAKAWALSRCPGRVLMIGDTPHDVYVAYAAGFTPVTVLGGHADLATLQRTGAAVYPNFDALRKELL